MASSLYPNRALCDLLNGPSTSKAHLNNPSPDCKILIMEPQITSKYGSYIYERLSANGIRAVPIYLQLASYVNVNALLSDFTRKGTICAIYVSPSHMSKNSANIHILQGSPECHRNMPLEAGIKLICERCKLAEIELKNKMLIVEQQRVAAAAAAAPAVEKPPVEKPPVERLVLTAAEEKHINLLQSGKQLKVEEYDFLINFARDLRQRQYNKEVLQMEDEPEIVIDPATKVEGNFYYHDLESIKADKEVCDLLSHKEVQAALQDVIDSDLFECMVNSLPPKGHNKPTSSRRGAKK